VSIGSGHREHPLGTDVADRFYMLRDVNVFTPPRNQSGQIAYPAPQTEGSLLDVTDNPTPTLDALNEHTGWLIRLTGGGEKVLASALTADNKVFFTSYLPSVVQEPTCDLAGVIGSGRLYSVELLSGAPVIFTDDITPEDRYEELARGGIPPAPVPVFTLPPCQGEDCQGEGDPGDPPDPTDPGGGGCTNPFSQVTLLVATEARDPRICNAPQRTYWRQGGNAR
jgi:type IV pilus assembly protein PilY1